MDAANSIIEYTITLRTLAGEQIVLTSMQPSDTVRDIQFKIRSQLQMPVSVQRLVWGTTVLVASSTLEATFGATANPDVNLIRRPFTPVERTELHKQLVRASAGGRVNEVRELLKEGAQVNFQPLENDRDESVSLSHWEDALENSTEEALFAGCSSHSDAQAKLAQRLACINSAGELEHHDDGATNDESRKVHRQDHTSSLKTNGACPSKMHHPCGGLSPLLVALIGGHDEIAKDLRQLGSLEVDFPVDMDRSGQNDQATQALKEAFARNDFLDVATQMRLGADLDVYMPRGHGVLGALDVWSIWPGTEAKFGAPLHACAAMHKVPGAYETAQLLIVLKADLNAGDAEGDSPLAHARFFEARDLFALYQSRGAKMQGPFYSALRHH